MRPEELTALLKAQPFVPVRIHMTDGQIYDIRHPEVVWVLRQRFDVAIGPDPTTGVVERVEHCSLLHVVRVEELQSSTSPKNGPPK